MAEVYSNPAKPGWGVWHLVPYWLREIIEGLSLVNVCSINYFFIDQLMFSILF